MTVPMWNGAGFSAARALLQGLTANQKRNIEGTSGTKALFPSFDLNNGAKGAVGKTESDFMFAILAITIISGAFFLALATIVWMFAQYQEKMIAALRFEPIPQAAPVYALRISRRRVGDVARHASISGGILTA